MHVEKLHREFLRSAGICTDTRKEVEDRIFFALRGERFDGNDYVEEALRKGCRLAVTEREIPGDSGRLLIVDAALGCLQELARYHRMHVSPLVLCITGSNGKTTTKELVSSVLSRKFSVAATRGNLNNHIGVPLTLLDLKDEDMAVVEMGANHQGEIKALADIAAPDLGLITNVGKAHLEGFGSLGGVLEAKGELYEDLLKRGGKAIVDGNDPVLMEKASHTGVEMVVIGNRDGIPVSCRITDQSPFLEVEVDLDGRIYGCMTRLVGSYNLQNILFGAAIGTYFGVPAESVLEAIGSYWPQNHRSQFIRGEKNQVILDTYNANPTSMREAIRGLMEFASSRTMLILGDMAEMGDAADREHSELAHWIDSLPVDRVILAGQQFSRVCEPSSRILIFREKEELASYLESEPVSGFQILLKGSRNMEMESLVKYL